MASEDDLFTLDSGAQVARVHRTTLYRAVKKGELHATTIQAVGQKTQYLVASKDLEQWIWQRQQGSKCKEPASANVHPHQDVQHDTLKVLAASLEKTAQSLNLALHEAQSARADCSALQQQNQRLERQMVALRMELNSYELALADSAESIQETRAAQAQLEAQLQERKSASEELGKLKVARTEPSFQPRKSWWRRLFSTG